ncbi:MAG: tRNA (N6-threonylcarbamoyladenosine(37)-N6)-methyltransferase TrmO [Desulfuromonas sp.]|nr:MAG: tRNA (N6-threonylcarbamoyladenosine(37)-N6)-methyltransferase TrmO [Desulfuromonas sp.]
MNYPLDPIAVIRSPYREKFATPRQPGLTPSVRAIVEFYPGFCPPEAVRGLEGFSHIWLLFLFHQNWQKGWQPTVRPPRLGGNKRVGVYASRSPFRPNPIGLSAVKLLGIDCTEGRATLEIEGADLIDGTPVLDIKPYLPYGDSIADARGGFAEKAPGEQLVVEFSPEAMIDLQHYQAVSPRLKMMICETLVLDPRPAYQRNDNSQREYGMLLEAYNVRWQVRENVALVTRILPAE